MDRIPAVMKGVENHSKKSTRKKRRNGGKRKRLRDSGYPNKRGNIIHNLPQKLARWGSKDPAGIPVQRQCRNSTDQYRLMLDQCRLSTAMFAEKENMSRICYNHCTMIWPPVNIRLEPISSMEARLELRGNAPYRVHLRVMLLDHLRSTVHQRWDNVPVENDKPVSLAVPLESGEIYRFCMKLEILETGQVVVSKPYPGLKAVYNKKELAQLYIKAMDHVKHYQLKRCKLAYRNKPKDHFKDIYELDGGVMYPYEKDDNGDPASPINGRLDGLFFSVSLKESGRMPRRSPFGERRLVIPMERLMPYSPSIKLYFADFYCNTASGLHYVTLVMTRENSRADEFCKDWLRELSLVGNPFLHWDGQGGYLGLHSDTVWVELFYTEPIDIQKETIIDHIPPIGHGASHGGSLKNRECRICNI